MGNAILGPCLDHVAERAQAAGLRVVKVDGWRTRTKPPKSKANGGKFQPIGVIDHHTAPPVPGNLEKLSKACNISIRHPDGAVCLLNSGWAYDSGWGDRFVLAAVKADAPLPRPTDTYKTLDPDPIPGGMNPGVLGNPFFIDIEVQHLGDKSPLLEVMERALVVTNAALCEFMGWNPKTRVIGHREWTKRKIDPRWNGGANPMPGLRSATAAQLDPTFVANQPVTQPPADNIGDDDDMAFTPEEQDFLKDFVKIVSIDMGSSRHFAKSAILDIRKDVITRDELIQLYTGLPKESVEKAHAELLKRLRAKT